MPEATEVEVGKFIDAYNMAAQLDTDVPFDLKKTDISYDFEFTYDSTDSKTSIAAIGEYAKYMALINTLLSVFSFPPQNQPTDSLAVISFKLSDGVFNIKEKAEGKSVFSSFDQTKTLSITYELSFYLTDFKGGLMEENVTPCYTDENGTSYTFPDFYKKVFGDETNGYKLVKVSFTDDPTKPCFYIEGIDLENTSGEILKIKGFLTELWSFLFGQVIPGETGFPSVIKKFMDKQYKGLAECSYNRTCEKALENEINQYFTKIEDSKLTLKSKVTEEGTQMLDDPEAYFLPKMDLEYLTWWKMDADIRISAKLDGKNYVFTYSTNNEILSINGRAYSCPTWNFN